MKRLSILIGISCISITVFAVMRTILLTKEEMKDAELSKEAENASRIKVKDCGGAVQITDIHVIDK